MEDSDWYFRAAVLEYVFSTSDFGITFQRGSGLELVAFADANYASKAIDKRSVSGGAIMCAGACVCWFSRTKKCVTLSTTEAEYEALADTIKEAMFMRYVWSFIFPGFGEVCVTVFDLELYLSFISNDNAVFPWLILRIMPFFLALNFVDF